MNSIVNKFYKQETLVTQSKFAASGVKIEIMSNRELAEESRKPIIRKFEK